MTPDTPFASAQQAETVAAILEALRAQSQILGPEWNPPVAMTIKPGDVGWTLIEKSGRSPHMVSMMMTCGGVQWLLNRPADVADFLVQVAPPPAPPARARRPRAPRPAPVPQAAPVAP